VEERLSFDKPVEHGNVCYLREPVELQGTLLPKGSMVALMLSSAKRLSYVGIDEAAAIIPKGRADLAFANPPLPL